MDRRRKQEDEIAAATGEAPMSDQAIMEEVLGHRSGYRRGFGYGMPIDPQSVAYYEQPRDEDMVHSEYDRSDQQREVQKLREEVNMLLNYVQPPPMSSYGQYPPYQPAAPHMGTSTSGPSPSQTGFSPFTPAAPHPYPYPGFYGMPSQPPTFTHMPHDPPHASPGSSGQQRGQPPTSGFAPWSGGPGFGQFQSQMPPFGSYTFPGPAPAAGPSSSQFPPQTPSSPPVYRPTPPSTSPTTMSQTATVIGSGRARQRLHNRRGS